MDSPHQPACHFLARPGTLGELRGAPCWLRLQAHFCLVGWVPHTLLSFCIVPPAVSPVCALLPISPTCSVSQVSAHPRPTQLSAMSTPLQTLPPVIVTKMITNIYQTPIMSQVVLFTPFHFHTQKTMEHYCCHFIDEETEDQQGEATYSRSNNLW